MARTVGIDLGTTNSEIAVYERGSVRVIDHEGDPILPSFVSLSEGGELMVGHPARNQYLLYPERTVKSIKRKMGSDARVTLGDREYSPPEISALILRELKRRAEESLGEQVTRAVITVPAYFTDAQRKDTRLAGELAGLEVVRIINEPTAASLVYEPGQSTARKIVVYDLGGGTFDASLIQLEGGLVEVLSSHGNNRLGGDDFDAALLEHVLTRFQEVQGVDLRQDRKAMARLLRSVEEGKKTLSSRPFVTIEEEAITHHQGRLLNLSLEIARTDYEELIGSFIDETLRAIHTVLKDGGISPGHLDGIILVGGATRTPMVVRRIEEEFGIVPRHEVNPDLAVAMGAAIQAALIDGEQVQKVLVDITPYTFGTSCVNRKDGAFYEHCFAPVIRRNTPLPCSASEVFYTMIDGQETVEVTVYQGEHQDALMNTLIGRFMFEDLSDVPAPNEILFHLDLDINGILHVKAEEKRTGRQKSLLIKNAFNPASVIDIEDARRRLSALKTSRDSGGMSGPPEHVPATMAGEAPPMPAELKKEAEALLERGRRVLEQISADDRAEVIDLLEQIREALERGDREGLEEPSEALKELLFYLA